MLIDDVVNEWFSQCNELVERDLEECELVRNWKYDEIKVLRKKIYLCGSIASVA